MKIISKIFFVFFSIFILLHFSSVSAYPGWFKYYGGTQEDSGESIRQTSDGGYIVTGSIESYTHGGRDFAIYRLDSNGNKIWFKHYGGTSNDSGESIQQTSDGGYIVAGRTESYTYGTTDMAIYRLDSSGNKVWFKHYGGSDSDYAKSVQQTSEGGYIVAGVTYSYTYGGSDSAIYKLDSSGNKQWFKHYGGLDNDGSYSIQQTSDGGYIVGGYSNSYAYGVSNNSDFAIYKLDSNGDKTWFKHYGGVSNDYGTSIQQTTDGGYIVAGYTYSYTYGNTDFGIYKLDSNGNKQWFKHYGGNDNDVSHSIQQTSDGGYIVAGWSSSYTHGSNDYAAYKLTSSGSNVWFKHYGGTSSEYGYEIQQTSDGGYIFVGKTYSYSYGSGDFGIYKLDSNGDK